MSKFDTELIELVHRETVFASPKRKIQAIESLLRVAAAVTVMQAGENSKALDRMLEACSQRLWDFAAGMQHDDKLKNLRENVRKAK